VKSVLDQRPKGKVTVKEKRIYEYMRGWLGSWLLQLFKLVVVGREGGETQAGGRACLIWRWAAESVGTEHQTGQAGASPQPAGIGVRGSMLPI
jgi:hypothetical protein